jgi:uncharacterized protein
MLKLTVRIRHRDEHGGKAIADLLLALYRRSGITGATVLQGIRGYGVRGSSRADVLGLSLNLPVVIETVDDPAKIHGVLAEVKLIVESNGLITLEEVDVV